MAWPLRCVRREPLVLVGRSMLHGARDRSKRGQQRRRSQASKARQTCGRLRRADVRNSRSRPRLNRDAWFRGPHRALPRRGRGNRGGLVRQLGQRVLRHQLPFAFWR